jgi:hypothetical protein
MERYRHTQIGWVILVTAAGIAAIALPILWNLEVGLALWVFSAIEFLLIFLFGWLRVTVTQDQVSVAFGIGLVRKSFQVSEIRAVREVRNSWVWGWGIRFTPAGTLYNVSGLDAVELRMVDGRGFRIGTDEPAELHRAIRAVTGELAPLTAQELSAARGRSRTSLIVMLAVVVVLIGGLMILMAYQSRPAVVTVHGGVVEISNLFYGARLQPHEIQSVSLEPQLPRIRMRTNGYALGATLRGHFRVDTYGDAQLFVQADKPPFVWIQSSKGLFVVNFDQPLQTQQLYARLQQVSPATR